MSEHRTVAITGTSSGIGLAVAIEAALRGFRVVATARDLTRLGPLQKAADEAGVGLDIAQLDVTDPKSRTNCIADIVHRYGRLDALINNAGATHVNTVENDNLDAIRATMEVNFFGVVALTQAAMPHLRAAAGRLITVTSIGGIMGQPFNEAYCASKFAIEGFMESLAPVAATVGVRVSVVEPGAVTSSLLENAALDQEALIAQAGPYAGPLRRYFARTAGAFANAQSADSAARVIVDVLESIAPPFRVQTSQVARERVAIKVSDVDGSGIQRLTSSWIELGESS